MTKITLHGIPNCDTMKKARTWLDTHGLAYDFHDYKKAGITTEKLNAWADAVGWEVLLNKAGTTFRKLPDADKVAIDRAKAIALMVEQPSLIKRPVLDHPGGYWSGSSPISMHACSAEESRRAAVISLSSFPSRANH